MQVKKERLKKILAEFVADFNEALDECPDEMLPDEKHTKSMAALMLAEATYQVLSRFS